MRYAAVSCCARIALPFADFAIENWKLARRAVVFAKKTDQPRKIQYFKLEASLLWLGPCRQSGKAKYNAHCNCQEWSCPNSNLVGLLHLATTCAYVESCLCFPRNSTKMLPEVIAWTVQCIRHSSHLCLFTVPMRSEALQLLAVLFVKSGPVSIYRHFW